MMKDFFISYNRADKQWAEWIAWTLEEAGYHVLIQAWDFQPGGNFVLEMQKASAETQKTIAILSESYLKSSYTQPEWAAAFAQDPQGLERKFIPVRVKECKPEGMLSPIVYVDLIGLTEEEAKQKLLDSLRPRIKPDRSPAFPGTEVQGKTTVTTEIEQSIEEPKPFPSALTRVQQIKEKSLLAQLESLGADYEAVSKQLEFTSNAADRKRLERQLNAIAQELEQVAIKLDELQK